MSWLFSQALVEEYSAATFSDGEPSAQWNVMPTPQGFWRNDKMMDASRLSQFGPTLRLLTEQHGEAVLMSFLAAFPARTYPQPERARESVGQDPDFGLSSLESLAKFDPDTSTWRTPQFSLLGDWDLYSETWPRWGLMRDGECWVQPMLALRTSGTESGLWQTPVADDAANRKAGKWNSRGEPKLSGQVASPNHWPTPTVCGNYNRKGVSKTSGDGLATAVRNWPTPVASMHKGSSPASLKRKSGKSRENDRLGHAVMASDGGQLNPQWVEWLMGWPIEWTDLKPLAMAKFREWQQQHSPNLQEGSDAA